MRRVIAIVLCLVILVAISGCSVTINGNEPGFNSGQLIVDNDYTENGASLNELFIANQAGDIELQKAEGSDVKIHVEKKVKGWSSNERSQMMEDISIEVKKDGSKLYIEAKDKEGKKFGFLKGRKFNVTIKYIIKIPGNIKAFDINNTAGNIKINDISGSVDLSTAAGNVEISDVKLLGSNSIDMNAGNIQLDVNLDEADSLDIENDAGNVNLYLPDNSKFDLSSKISIGKISGSFLSGTRLLSGKRDEQINGGGTDVSINVAVGNIGVDKN